MKKIICSFAVVLILQSTMLFATDLVMFNEDLAPEKIVEKAYPATDQAIDSITGQKVEFYPCLDCLNDYFDDELIAFFDYIDRYYAFCGGYDPVCAGQEYALTGLKIRPAKIMKEKALVKAIFKNFGIDTVVNFHFVRKNNRWKLYDLSSGGTSYLDVLKADCLEDMLKKAQ